MADGETTKPEGEGDVRHKYRICEVQPRQKQFGRPRRATIIGWDDVSPDDLVLLRRLHEPRLAANQIAELDGRTVARGRDVAQADIDDSEPVPHAVLRAETPEQVTEFAHRMCWDIYERDMAASEELRKQARQLSQQALEHAKQVDQMLAEIVGMRADLLRQQQAQQAQQAQRGVSVQDIKEIMQAGAFLVISVSAYYLLRRQHEAFAKASMKVGLG